MRLLSVIHGPVFGGAHNQLLQLARPLSDRGCETTALLPDEPGNAVPRLRAAGIDVVVLPLRRLRATTRPAAHADLIRGLPSEVGSLRALIRKLGIDVVQAHGPTNPHAGLAGRLERRGVVWQLYDTRTPMALRRMSMPLVLALADVVTSWGVAVARVHPGATRLGERLVPVFPPLDPAAYHAAPERRESARRELGVGEDAVLIGTVANLNPQKGHEHLLRAFDRVRSARPRVALRVLGAPSPSHPAYERALRWEAARLGLSPPACEFVDPGDRVPELVAGLDIFVLASVPRSEGMPTAILEAMACGVPVVATDVGSVSELVEDGSTGIVVPPEDPEAIARALCRLVERAEIRCSMGEEARRRAFSRYGLDALTNLHLGAYEMAIARAARRTA